jgi:hypothetical protein
MQRARLLLGGPYAAFSFRLIGVSTSTIAAAIFIGNPVGNHVARSPNVAVRLRSSERQGRRRAAAFIRERRDRPTAARRPLCEGDEPE